MCTSNNHQTLVTRKFVQVLLWRPMKTTAARCCTKHQVTQ